MTVDDLSKPLGQEPPKHRRKFPVAIPQVVAAALSIFLGVFVLWAVVGDDPFGGEPMVAVPIDLHAAMMPKKSEVASAPETTNPAAQALRPTRRSVQRSGSDCGPANPGRSPGISRPSPSSTGRPGSGRR